MILEILDGLSNPIILNASRVLVRGPRGTPIMVAAEWGPGEIRCAHLDDPAFLQVLRNLGVEDTVMAREVRIPTAADFVV